MLDLGCVRKLLPAKREGRTRPRVRGFQKSTTSSVCKERVLLLDPAWNSVVRQGMKASLIEDGFVLSVFVMDKQWTAEALRGALEDAFLEKLK